MIGTKRSRRAGFTLIEAMISMVLMVFVLSALATVTTQWLRNWDRGFARLQRVDLWSAGLQSLMADVSAAEFVSLGGGTEKPAFDGSAHAVTFVRTALGPNSSTGLELVRIANGTDDRGPALVRWTAPFVPGRTPAQSDFGNPIVLMRAPSPVFFSYAGPDRGWRKSWRDQAQLPRTFRVEIAGGGGRVAVSTSAVLRAEVPARCALPTGSIEECLNGKTTPTGGQSADAGANRAQRE